MNTGNRSGQTYKTTGPSRLGSGNALDPYFGGYWFESLNKQINYILFKIF